MWVLTVSNRVISEIPNRYLNRTKVVSAITALQRNALVDTPNCTKIYLFISFVDALFVRGQACLFLFWKSVEFVEF